MVLLGGVVSNNKHQAEADSLSTETRPKYSLTLAVEDYENMLTIKQESGPLTTIHGHGSTHS